MKQLKLRKNNHEGVAREKGFYLRIEWTIGGKCIAYIGFLFFSAKFDITKWVSKNRHLFINCNLIED